MKLNCDVDLIILMPRRKDGSSCPRKSNSKCLVSIPYFRAIDWISDDAADAGDNDNDDFDWNCD